MHDGQVDEFDGDISDYGKWLSDKRKEANSSDKGGNKKGKNKKDKKKFIEKSTVSRETKLEGNASQKSTSVNTNSKTAAPSTLSKEEQRKLAAEQRNLTAPIRRDIENIEKALTKIDAQLAMLEDQLADTTLYDDSRKADLLKLLNEQTAQQQQHSEYEEKLLLAMTTLEDMEASFS